MHGFDAIAAALAKEGVRHIFGLAGSDNVELLESLDRARLVKVISTRTETGATAMADGYSRVTGSVGVATVTVGPGLSNAGTALTVARRRGSPLVCITTEGGVFNRGNPKWGFDQRQFAETTAGRYLSVRHKDSLAEDILMAFRHVRSGKGPVVLAVPREIMQADLGVDWEYSPSGNRMPAPYRMRPEPEAIARAADILRVAERPVILVGRGASESGAGEEIKGLADRTGALLATTLMAKGYLSDHPSSIGVCGYFASQGATTLFARADCVVAVGCGLSHQTTLFGASFPRARIIHVDCDSARIGDTTPVCLGVVGDARASVAALNAELGSNGASAKEDPWEEEKDIIASCRAARRISYAESADSIDPRQLLTEVDKVLPKERVVVVDGGHNMFFAASLVSAPSPERFIWLAADFSCIGMGVYQGIGAALGQSEGHTVVFSGDGGFMMTLDELDTAVRYRIPMTIMVMNDGSFGAEVHFLERKGKQGNIVCYDNPDFAKVASALGAVGLTVRNVKDMSAISDILAREKGPVVVDARINRSVISEVWQGLHTHDKRK